MRSLPIVFLSRVRQDIFVFTIVGAAHWEPKDGGDPPLLAELKLANPDTALEEFNRECLSQWPTFAPAGGTNHRSDLIAEYD